MINFLVLVCLALLAASAYFLLAVIWASGRRKVMIFRSFLSFSGMVCVSLYAGSLLSRQRLEILLMTGRMLRGKHPPKAVAMPCDQRHLGAAFGLRGVGADLLARRSKLSRMQPISASSGSDFSHTIPASGRIFRAWGLPWRRRSRRNRGSPQHLPGDSIGSDGHARVGLLCTYEKEPLLVAVGQIARRKRRGITP